MPTLAELAGFGPGTSLLGQLTGAIDERTRYYGNLVRGLIDDPAALMEMLHAQNAENMRERAQAAQGVLSVVPEIREEALHNGFQDAMNIGGLMGTAKIVKGSLPSVGKVLNGLPDGYQLYPSKSAALKFTDYGSITATTDGGKYFARLRSNAGQGSKPFYAVGDSIQEAESALLEEAKRVAAAASKKEASTLRGRLLSEFGDVFSFGGSTQSKSKYITHKPSGMKIRISDHKLPLHYEGADLNLPSNLSDKELFGRIKKFLMPDE